MVNKYIKYSFLLLILCVSTFSSNAQNPEELVKKDFPKLYGKYGNQLKQQKARYVFAIDISNSMKSYETSVKTNIKNFISALPEGDFVTIIQKCGTQETDFIFSNQPVNSSTKSTIFSYIDAIKFDKTGSDGFKMTEKIIEALNQTGSSDDMKYVFMFTDFEYWTKKNQFNKNVENWESLKTKFEQTQKGNFVTVTGLRLALSQGVKASAVYETELKDIFGKVEILPSPNPVFLATWFNNTKANILRDRLTYVIGKLAKKEKQTIALSTKSENGKPAIILSNNSIFQKATLTDASQKEVNEIYNSRPLIGPFTSKPEIVNVEATLSSPDYNSDKGNEVEKITSLAISKHTIDVYHGPGYLPWYFGWPLVVLLVFWIGSIVFHLITFRSKRNWYIKASFEKEKRNDWVWDHDEEPPTVYEKDAFTISEDSSDCSIPEINARLDITYKRNIFCIPFISNIKRGYYLHAQQYEGELKVVVNNKGIDLNGYTTWIGACGNSFKICVLIITSTSPIDKKRRTITLQ